MTELIKGQAVTTTIKAVITTTSNKVGTFKDKPKKSLYLNVTDKESLNKLNDLGIREYTSKDGENFHIIKASESITLWVNGEDQELNTDITSKNFTTVKDDKEIEVELFTWEKEDYVETKTAFAEKLIRLFEERSGYVVTPYIEEIEIATPWTMCNYVNTPEGSAYGFELKDWDGMMPRMMMMGTEFPVKGLKFVGAASIRGDGYNSAIFSGDILAKKTLAEMQEEEA